jgi:uncharacterized low-complexity protein
MQKPPEIIQLIRLEHTETNNRRRRNMSNKTHMKPVAAAIGAALAGSLAMGAANAADNPFGLSEIGSGYMQLASSNEDKGGEGKCGGEKAASTEGKCGGEKAASTEGKCGEGKCGEGKCGSEKTTSTEGKCGGNK